VNNSPVRFVDPLGLSPTPMPGLPAPVWPEPPKMPDRNDPVAGKDFGDVNANIGAGGIGVGVGDFWYQRGWDGNQTIGWTDDNPPWTGWFTWDPDERDWGFGGTYKPNPLCEIGLNCDSDNGWGGSAKLCGRF